MTCSLNMAFVSFHTETYSPALLYSGVPVADNSVDSGHAVSVQHRLHVLVETGNVFPKEKQQSIILVPSPAMYNWTRSFFPSALF